jgi:hypothetical protein
MKKTKIYFAIAFIFVVMIFIGGTKSEAASLLWPVGGDNADETYIEYWYEPRTYKSQDYIDKCKRDYNMDVYEGYYQNYENHYGVDIVGKPGETYSLVAVKDGTVLATSANYKSAQIGSINYVNRNQRKTSQGNGGGYGNYVAIKDDETGKCYFYAHIQAGTITVKQGDKVKAGQEIGKMGSSGDSGHMHLHFEVRRTPESLFMAPYTYNLYHFITVTTGYGIETENPVDYIGDKAPAKKKGNVIPGMAEEGTIKIYGDLNADNQVDLIDATLALRLYVIRMARLEDDYDYITEYADIDEDGEVSIADAQIILNFAVEYMFLDTEFTPTIVKDYYVNIMLNK